MREPIDTVERLNGARVLVVGDLMLDCFVYGEVERISPEAPIPVLQVKRAAAMLGGAGNVVRNLAALGASPRLVASIGDDEAGRRIAQLIAETAQEARLVRLPGRPTTVKTRFVAAAHQLLRTDAEDPRALDASALDELAGAAEAMLEGARALVLSDYAKGVLAPRLLTRLIAAAKARGVSVVVDPRGDDYRIYAGADVVTPNRNELRQATRMQVDSDDEVVAAASALLAAAGVGAVLATRGAQGMTLVASGAPPLHLKSRAREVFDVSGAGDTVVATLAAGLAGGATLADAVALANVAAGIVVGKLGTAVTRREELRAALRPAEPDIFSTVGGKRLSRAHAGQVAAVWRRQGLIVGFTNGCFDLLHPGHVHLLEQARAACDRMIVGLNSDASVRRLKGPARPAQDEAARAAVLAALGAVDAVVVFAEDTPLALIDAIRPDVLIKGADYRRDDVVGGSLVESYGGRVVLTELAPGHSTSATIAKLGG
jgi:D-beta-D-heptose 7-phosphate kinase / D-beta-D-heptose 1-phosphate adenosyltransferase